MRTAIDTNVISALWSAGPLASQFATVLGRAGIEGGLVICGPVYAELLAHPDATEQFVDEFLATTHVSVDFTLDEAVWRDAGRRFASYARRRRRSRGRDPKRLLVDFLIGAHASLCADRLLTLDNRRYSKDFPNLRLM
ncbi:MAG: type II toxin-antitoxin system VapC family toxin [Gammaproteobacteria bacterium]